MGRVLHASYSGYFPFCISSYDQKEITPIYAPIDISPLMRIWWRIKKVRFYGTYVLDPFVTPETRDWEFVVQRNSETEEGLVCNPSPGWVTISQLNIDGSSGFFLNTVYSEGQEYVVDASFRATFFAGGAQEQGVSYVSLYDVNLSTYDFEGLIFYRTGDNNTYHEFTTINHEILEYWSYGGLYNTETGEPL